LDKTLIFALKLIVQPLSGLSIFSFLSLTEGFFDEIDVSTWEIFSRITAKDIKKDINIPKQPSPPE
jgi:hypothetical protein